MAVAVRDRRHGFRDNELSPADVRVLSTMPQLDQPLPGTEVCKLVILYGEEALHGIVTQATRLSEFLRCEAMSWFPHTIRAAQFPDGSPPFMGFSRLLQRSCLAPEDPNLPNRLCVYPCDWKVPVVQPRPFLDIS